MSEQKFKEARSSLAFSQSLRDRLLTPQMPQEGMMMEEEMPVDNSMEEEVVQEEMPEEETVEEEVEPEEEEDEEDEEDMKGMLQKGIEGMQSFVTALGDYFKKEEKEDEVQDVQKM